MPQNEHVSLLMHLDVIHKLLPTLGSQQRQTLYLNDDNSPHRFGMWCALLDDEAAAKALTHDSWDLMIGDYQPGYSQGYEDGEMVATYHRYGSFDGVRPLLMKRSFHGAFPEYFDLDEEFRLYHRLAHDHERRLLLDFDESGREIEVVRIQERKVSTLLKYLRKPLTGCLSARSSGRIHAVGHEDETVDGTGEKASEAHAGAVAFRGAELAA